MRKSAAIIFAVYHYHNPGSAGVIISSAKKESKPIEYTNNSPDELNVAYTFTCSWNAFKPNSMMDQRVSFPRENGDGRFCRKTVFQHFCYPEDQEGGTEYSTWIKQNGKDLKFEVQETHYESVSGRPIKPILQQPLDDWDAVILSRSEEVEETTEKCGYDHDTMVS
ncbi:hypothetical protein FQA39_LY18914 [Lamprigera yunnana]|nr:hypothetical protein FQA39_LY18914 [Lamprigera yunnana]